MSPWRRAHRDVVVTREHVALAEFHDADADVLNAGADNLFRPDPDPRRLPVLPWVQRFVVLDAESGTLLGDLSWLPVLHGSTMGCVAWNIGIMLLPSARGRGVGTLAQRLLVEHLFATTEPDRIEASTDVDNFVEQRALEKVGMLREGVIRGATVRGGVRRDSVLYGILRSDL